jgi:hypothetical protein
MKAIIRRLCLLLCLVMVLTALIACDKDPQDPVPPDPDSSETPEPQPPVEQTVDVIKDGKTTFRIVRGDLFNMNDTSTQLSIALRKAIVTATGCEIELITDYTEASDSIPEIIIGETTRAAGKDIALENNQFLVYYDGKDIVLRGNTDYAL